MGLIKTTFLILGLVLITDMLGSMSEARRWKPYWDPYVSGSYYPLRRRADLPEEDGSSTTEASDPDSTTESSDPYSTTEAPDPDSTTPAPVSDIPIDDDIQQAYNEAMEELEQDSAKSGKKPAGSAGPTAALPSILPIPGFDIAEILKIIVSACRRPPFKTSSPICKFLTKIGCK